MRYDSTPVDVSPIAKQFGLLGTTRISSKAIRCYLAERGETSSTAIRRRAFGVLKAAGNVMARITTPPPGRYPFGVRLDDGSIGNFALRVFLADGAKEVCIEALTE
jgi:hypothetical protein